MPSNIQYQSSRCGTNRLEIIGKHIFVNGKLTDGVPPSNYYKVSQINDRLFVNGYEYMRMLGNSISQRYSDLPDEIQVKDMVSMDKMTLVTFPTRYYLDDSLFSNKTILFKRLRRELEEVNKLLSKYNYEVPVYDIESGTLLDEENAYRLVMEYKNKK